MACTASPMKQICSEREETRGGDEISVGSQERDEQPRKGFERTLPPVEIHSASGASSVISQCSVLEKCRMALRSVGSHALSRSSRTSLIGFLSRQSSDAVCLASACVNVCASRETSSQWCKRRRDAEEGGTHEGEGAAVLHRVRADVRVGPEPGPDVAVEQVCCRPSSAQAKAREGERERETHERRLGRQQCPRSS